MKSLPLVGPSRPASDRDAPSAHARPAAAIAQRIRRGEHTIVVGPLPALDRDLTLVRIPCGWPSGHAPLERAIDLIDAVLGASADLQRERSELGAYRRVLEGTPFQPSDVRFVDACNRLASSTLGNAALVLDGFDDADDDTHEALARILDAPGWLRLPLVLVVRRAPREALAPELDAPVVEAARVEPAPPSVADDLPPATLRVLRAAAVVGATFEPRLVAVLLDADVDAVLEELQAAVDHGAPVVDCGDGRLAMRDDFARALADSVLPSLRARYDERLARELAPSSRPALQPVAIPDPLRAARHLDAAGRRDEAVGTRLDAVAAMIRAGDAKRAATLLDATSRDAALVADPRARSLVAAQVALARARLRWIGVVVPSTLRDALADVETARALLPAEAPVALRVELAATAAGILCDLGDPSSNAAALRELADAAADALERGAPFEAARLMTSEAVVRVRLGDVERGERLVTQARQLFLGRLREVPDDDDARAALADADHVAARIPLHAPPERGRVGEALRAAMRSAEVAAQAYERLGMRRELARVWETLARLETRLGDRPAARAHLEAALDAEEEMGDVTGLARATAALAEVLARSGRPVEALAMLAASIDINRARRSTIGLVADSRALAAIRRAAPPRPDADVAPKLAELSERLASAMQDVGGELHELTRGAA